MKVMHIISGLRTGGAETQLRLLMRHSVTQAVAVALTNAEEVAKGIRDDGFQVFDLGMRTNHDVTALGRLARLTAQQRPDVVHVHLYRATLYGRVAARLAGIPTVITTEHSVLDGEVEGRRTSASVKALYLGTEPLNTATIAVSDEVAARLARWGVPARKLHVIPNGIEVGTALLTSPQAAESRATLRKRLGIAPGAKLVGGIGRLHRAKRWDLLLQAVADDLNEELHVMLVGAGEEEAPLRTLIATLGIGSWVHMTGTMSDISFALAAMDLVVSSAPQETFGLAVVEAAAAGRPVVYVHSPGLDALGQLPGVTKVTAHPASIRSAVLHALHHPTVPPATAFDRYHISSTARHVDRLYEQYRRKQYE